MENKFYRPNRKKHRYVNLPLLTHCNRENTMRKEKCAKKIFGQSCVGTGLYVPTK